MNAVFLASPAQAVYQEEAPLGEGSAKPAALHEQIAPCSGVSLPPLFFKGWEHGGGGGL